MAGKSKKNGAPSFEQALGQLETLVDRMEQGELSLEESLQAFEEGVRLTKICQQALQQAEQKVEILSSNHPDAELEPFDSES